MDSKIDLRSKMISVYLNLVFYVFLFIKISSICPAAAVADYFDKYAHGSIWF